jgi:hypothetical protein
VEILALPHDRQRFQLAAMKVKQGESIRLVWSVAYKGEGTEIAQAFNKLARSFVAKGANSLLISGAMISASVGLVAQSGNPAKAAAMLRTIELPPLKWSSLKYDFVGGLFDGEEAYG